MSAPLSCRTGHRWGLSHVASGEIVPFYVPAPPNAGFAFPFLQAAPATADWVCRASDILIQAAQRSLEAGISICLPPDASRVLGIVDSWLEQSSLSSTVVSP